MAYVSLLIAPTAFGDMHTPSSGAHSHNARKQEHMAELASEPSTQTQVVSVRKYPLEIGTASRFVTISLLAEVQVVRFSTTPKCVPSRPVPRAVLNT